MKKNYNKYKFTCKDWLIFFIRIFLKGAVICYLFYDTPKAFIFFAPFLFLEYKTYREDRIRRQKEELTLQFKSMIEALVTSLNAGYSLEHSFADAKRDLSLIYDGDALIFEEMDIILQGLKINIPLETLLKDFGNRSGIEDINNFANVVTVAKKSGGNLIRIIGKTVGSISDKLAVEEEIKTMITAKKLEEQIMMLMPYGIIFYLRMTSAGFLDVLYHNAFGVLLMTVFLAVIYAADWWAKRIMEISV